MKTLTIGNEELKNLEKIGEFSIQGSVVKVYVDAPANYVCLELPLPVEDQVADRNGVLTDIRLWLPEDTAKFLSKLLDRAAETLKVSRV